MLPWAFDNGKKKDKEGGIFLWLFHPHCDLFGVATQDFLRISLIINGAVNPCVCSVNILLTRL